MSVFKHRPKKLLSDAPMSNDNNPRQLDFLSLYPSFMGSTFSADFDGDELNIFVPSSLQTQKELEQLERLWVCDYSTIFDTWQDKSSST